MMPASKDVLTKALQLSPLEKAQLIDQLIVTLDKPDAELDKLWAKEAESRLAAYKNGDLKAVSIEAVLSKYK